MSIVELNIATTVVNLLLGLALLMIFINHRSDLLKTHTDFLTLTLIIIGVLLSLGANIYYDLFILFEGRISYGLCQYSGTLVTLIVGGNQSVHAIIAVERFLRITGSNFWGARYLAIFIAAFSFASIGSALGVMWMRGFHEMESKVWCFFDFSSSDELDLTGNLIAMIFIIINTLIIIACYGAIYLKVNEEKKKVNEILNVKSHAVAKKFVIIAIAYFLAYAPSYGTFLYRFISRSRIPKELEIFASFLTLCEPSITFSLLFYLNSKYRRGFQKLIPTMFRSEIDSDKVKSTTQRRETRTENSRIV